MPIRANGQREDRRRRVLMDDRSEAEASSQTKSKRSPKSANDNKRAYAMEACREHQPVITDVVPRRPWTLCVVVLLGLCLVAAPQSLYALTTVVSGQEFLALRLQGTSTIAAWVSSLLLASCSVFCWVIYLVRRHRLDDYRARYRWWLVVGAIFLFASLNACTHVHRIVPVAMVQWTGRELAAGGEIWSEIVLGTILALIAIRMCIEVRRCRLALAGIGLAVCGYVFHSLIQRDVLPIDSVVLAEMASTACMHLSHLLMAITLAVYARYVYRDAHGELPVAQPKKTTRKRTRKPVEDKDAKAEPAKTKTTRKSRVSKSETDSASEDEANQSETDDETLDFQKLSKSERRRLRKQQRRERQAA